MKHKTIPLVFLFTTFVTCLFAKKPKPKIFQNTYVRAGVSFLGNSLNNQLSPNGNILAGNYGADIGYAAEIGKIFYFNELSLGQQIQVGLDWTLVSFTFNQISTNKWYNYGIENGATDVMPKGGRKSASFASKIGPVISFNLIEKFVVDARIQLSYIIRYSGLDYFDTKNQINRNFSFYNPDDPNYKYSRISPSVTTNFGISVRRENIGLSLDYLSSNVNTNFSAQEEIGGFFTGKEKIPTNNLQIKLSYSL